MNVNVYTRPRLFKDGEELRRILEGTSDPSGDKASSDELEDHPTTCLLVHMLKRPAEIDYLRMGKS